MSASAPGESKVTFLDSGLGLAEWAQHVLDTEPDIARAARREKMLALVGVVPSAILLGVGFGYFIARDHADFRSFAVFAGVCIAIPVLFAIRGGAWHKSREMLVRLAGRPPHEPKHTTVSVEPDGVRVSGDESSAVYHWKAIQSVVRLPRSLAMTCNTAGGAIVVPRSAFTSETQAAEWESSLRERLDAAGYSESARVRAELDSGPLNCGRCGQNLRGIRDLRCPECGTALTVIRIRAWRLLQQPFWRSVFKRGS